MIDEKKIEEAARTRYFERAGIWIAESSRADFVIGFVEGAKWALEQNKWISISNKLPDEGQEIFICFINTAGTHVSGSIFKGSKFYYVAETNTGYYEEVFSCVTHWMPLPEPPKQ